MNVRNGESEFFFNKFLMIRIRIIIENVILDFKSS